MFEKANFVKWSSHVYCTHVERFETFWIMMSRVQTFVSIHVVIILIFLITTTAGFVVSASRPLATRRTGFSIAIRPWGRCRRRRWRCLLEAHGIRCPQGSHFIAADARHGAQTRNGARRHVDQFRGTVSRVCKSKFLHDKFSALLKFEA